MQGCSPPCNVTRSDRHAIAVVLRTRGPWVGRLADAAMWGEGHNASHRGSRLGDPAFPEAAAAGAGGSPSHAVMVSSTVATVKVANPTPHAPFE